MRAALLGEQNVARTVLETVMHYEKGEWTEVAVCAKALGVTVETIDQACAAARAWSDELTNGAAA